MNKIYDNTMFEIQMPEGEHGNSLEVTRFSGFPGWNEKEGVNRSMRFYAQVVGVKRSDRRESWGISEKDFDNRKLVLPKIKTVIKTVVKTKRIWDLRPPRTRLEKMFAKLGFYRKTL